MTIWDWVQMGLAVLFTGLWVTLIAAWLIAELRLRRNPKRLRPEHAQRKSAKVS